MSKKLIPILTAFSGIVIPLLFVGGLLGALLYAPWFSWTHNAISDLGRPQYGLYFFNYLLTAIGILLLIFSIGLYLLLRGPRFGPAALGLSSLYFIGVGLFPLPHQIHVEISGLFFIAFSLGFFLLGLKLYNHPLVQFKRLGKTALFVAFCSALSPIGLLFFPGIAISEIIILLPGFLWCSLYGMHILKMLKRY